MSELAVNRMKAAQLEDLIGSVFTHSSLPLTQSLREAFSGLRAGSVYHSMSQLRVLETSYCIGSSMARLKLEAAEDLAFTRNFEAVLGMHWLLRKYFSISSDICSEISGSWAVEMEGNSVSLGLVLWMMDHCSCATSVDKITLNY